MTQTANNSNTLLVMHQTQNAGEIDNIAQLNVAIVPNSLAQENEQVVNTIYLVTFARGIEVLTSLQYSTLFAIAQQCPYAGGRAVYRARALLSMINRNIAFNDDSTCTPLGLNKAILPKNEKHSINIIQISPNPANQNLQLFYNLIDVVNGYRILNVQGQVVGTGILNGNSGNRFIETSGLYNGLYTIVVKGNDGSIVQARFIIQK